MAKECKRHSKPVPMFPAMINFVSHNVLIGYYCINCHNFVPENNPEVEIYKNIMMRNQKQQ